MNGLLFLLLGYLSVKTAGDAVYRSNFSSDVVPTVTAYPFDCNITTPSHTESRKTSTSTIVIVVVIIFIVLCLAILAVVILIRKLKQRRKEKEAADEREREDQRRATETKGLINYRLDPLLIQTIHIEKDETIVGMTILDEELFISSERSSQIDVYDSLTFKFNRSWKLEELVNPGDMRSSRKDKCLYIIDRKRGGQQKEILRVDPDGKLILKWSTGNEYGESLSITDESNIVLTVSNKNKLNEYSSNGQLIREIKLSTDRGGIYHPMHAVKLNKGRFVVSHGDMGDLLHRVCIVDVDGKVKKSFGGEKGINEKEMNVPSYLAVDGDGSVVVLDRENSRVLLLTSGLEFTREILPKEKKGLQRPRRILLDESKDAVRLLVADNEWDKQRFAANERVLIFNII